jgi:hypothetical protein
MHVCTRRIFIDFPKRRFEIPLRRLAAESKLKTASAAELLSAANLGKRERPRWWSSIFRTGPASIA